METTVMAFSLEEAAKLSRLSTHQLRAWSRNLYGPSWPELGLYTFVDLVALRTLGRLRIEFNVRPAELRRARDHLRKHSSSPFSELKLGVGPGNRVYFWDGANRSWLSADGATQKITGLALDEISKAIQREVSNIRKRPKSAEGEVEQKRGVAGGKLRFKGTRIAVDAVRALLARKATNAEILKEFPSLSARDIAFARKNLSAA